MKNDFLNLTDLKTIISSELIPCLDLKNIFHYLEGLVADPGMDKVQRWNDLRKEKAEYFISEKDNYKEFLLLALEEKKEAEKRVLNFRGIIQDPAEYWKYVFDEGVITFFIDTYDEIYDFIQPDNHEKFYDQSLVDYFSMVKRNLLRILKMFELVKILPNHDKYMSKINKF